MGVRGSEQGANMAALWLLPAEVTRLRSGAPLINNRFTFPPEAEGLPGPARACSMLPGDSADTQPSAPSPASEKEAKAERVRANLSPSRAANKAEATSC